MACTPPSSPRHSSPRPEGRNLDAANTTAAGAAAPLADTDFGVALFSPGSKSSDTDGTGATGSTEPPGAATRSLLESVLAREDALRARTMVDGSADVFGTSPLASMHTASEGMSDDVSWHCVEKAASGDGGSAANLSDGSSAKQVEVTTPVYLPTPEPEELYHQASSPRSPASSQSMPADHSPHPSPNDANFIKSESDDEEDNHVLAPPAADQAIPHAPLEPDALTDSQEDVLLASSMTRSQSDFSHWLHETLRLAKGDGTSTIDSDDAVSSILEVTRHTRLSEPSELHDSQYTERASMLDFGVDALPDQDLTISTVPSAPVEPPSPASEGATQISVAESSSTDYQLEDKDERSATHISGHRIWPWQLLSLGLAVVLAYERWDHVTARAQMAATLPPTRSIAYMPLNQTVEVSHFPTPFAVGAKVSPLWHAVVFTLLAASGAALPSVLRRKGAPIQFPLPKHERDSSLSAPAFELAEARSQMATGIKLYARGHLSESVETFAAVLDLACPPAEKAIASEWLGRAHYRLGRVLGAASFENAVKAFERSIRLDPARASPRASLGRTLLRLDRPEAAVEALRAAIKRDDKLAFAHEWVAKALLRLEPVQSAMVEQHLRCAIELDPTSYKALACLGEHLYLRGGSSEQAKDALSRAVALRSDYPAAHLRLAHLANEQLDSVSADRHFSAALSSRHTGLRDPLGMPASESGLDGSATYLAWYFAMPARSSRRLAILRQAVADHPHEEMLGVLLAVEVATEGRCRATASGSSPTDNPTREVVERASLLSRRVTRFPAAEDIVAHGLYALALLALGSDKAEAAYQRFWTAVVDRRRIVAGSPTGTQVGLRDDDEERTLAYLAMAFFERRGLPVRTTKQISSGAPPAARPATSASPRSAGSSPVPVRSIKTSPKVIHAHQSPTPASTLTPTTTPRRSRRLAQATP
ncbi:hypothetical protein JCM10908_006529 [Rhodotorula pacifica]|uniref:tetratricopeptide repeat protein n=1 Tax=Rhodotorula pacifica TaxID=1495444 RepID=UPI003182A234